MKQYITTPIYYVNDIPHIGHAYTTILADMFKKYQSLNGVESMLLTGTDEHGQKIETSAKARNKTPQEYANEVSAKFRSLWDEFKIDYDYFVRTTDECHSIGVQNAFLKMFNNGDIYKGEYEGHYCVSCESFFTKRQLINEIACPDCGKDTTALKEESYFFKLSKYEKPLLEWYEKNPNVILPLHKRNEVIKFIENGLSDLSITRSTFKWGVSLPDSLNDERHIIYVWLDALLSYITPLGYGNNKENKMDMFSNAVHFVGKDILRFHAIYWPAFLLSLDLPLPKRIYAHGWWMNDGAKMSKSIGNVINPKEIAESYGLEILRYFLMREVPFGQDGDFSTKALLDRNNAELSDTLGNLLNRLLGMSEKYFSYKLESSDFSLFSDEINNINEIIKSLDLYMQNMQVNRYLEELWKIFNIANGLIAKYAPWEMMKNNEDSKCASLLTFIANILAKGALLIYPILPKSSQAMMQSLGISKDMYERLLIKQELLGSFNLSKIPPLFPKLELKESSENIAESSKSIIKDEINIKQFEKLDIRVGEVLEASHVSGSEKLLVFKIDFGDFGIRSIVSGIAKFYEPKDLLGKRICAIINLKPSKIMGIRSEGMILSTEDKAGRLSILSVESDIGSKVC